jgi:hypothetical protein
VTTTSGPFQYVINGVVGPTLVLDRGQTYLFDLTAFGSFHPFVINSNANDAFGTHFMGPSSGAVVSFTPGFALPPTIYYHCEVHYGTMVGTILLNDCMGVAGGSMLPGSTCSDGDPNTFNDVLGSDCVCAGMTEDCEGVPGGVALPGTGCNDGDPSTINDVYDANCACEGSAPPAPSCNGDLNNDGIVNTTDFGLFVAAYGGSCSNCPADLNDDQIVNISDFGLFVSAFGDTCQ